jgi:hypothetical protein
MILLRRTSSAGLIFQPIFIVRPYDFTTVHVESAVAPAHHIFDDELIDCSFRFKHFEHFMAKQIFKLNGIGRWAYHEGGLVVKAAIGGQGM